MEGRGHGEGHKGAGCGGVGPWEGGKGAGPLEGHKGEGWAMGGTERAGGVEGWSWRGSACPEG